MRNCIITVILLSFGLLAKAQSQKDRDAIYETLNRQVGDWNQGKVDAFMNGYWESDSLMFVGKGGVTYGYEATYQNYLKRYPDRATMGKLKFEFINLSFPGPGVAFLIGKFHLTRPEKGDIGGFYSLLWRKINSKWVIICDHTTQE